MITEKTPAGWEPTVKRMKTDPTIYNPWALANWMSDQGYAPGGKECENLAEAWKKYKAAEASAPSAAGQLYRPTREADKLLRWGVRFCEGARETMVDPRLRQVPVYIISEGPGNKVDKHFYTKEALQKSYARFDGAKCYADHPDKIEEQARPERSIRDIVGYFHSPEYVEVGGVGKVKALLKINQGDAFAWAWDMLVEALNYSDKFPSQDYIGISINADGVTSPVDKEDGTWHDVQDITRVVSADIVTQPAAGGKPLREAVPALRESVKAILESGATKGGTVEKHKEALMKASEALKTMRAAVAKDPAHDKAYGPALDEVSGHLDALHKALGDEPKKDEPKKEESEMAKPAEKDGQLEPVKATEEEAYAAESARFASGKMTEGEKHLFERWQGERMVRKAAADKVVVDKKLAESGIPAQFHDELRILMTGKTEKQMDVFVASRKALLESVTAARVPGAGGKTGGPEARTKMQEALAGSGLLKGGK